MTLRMISAAAVLALITGAGAWGYRAGRSAAEAEHNAERLARIEAARKLDAQRIVVAQERDALARQLEEAAQAPASCGMSAFTFVLSAMSLLASEKPPFHRPLDLRAPNS